MRAVVRLSCLDSELTEFIVTAISVSGLMGTFLLIILTYIFILSTVLKIPSAEGKQKAFSTCASHLAVVIIHFGFASIVYLKPGAPGGDDTVVAVPYTVITPFLSPLIFSLRNKDMKNAFRKVLGKTHFLNKQSWITDAWLNVLISQWGIYPVTWEVCTIYLSAEVGIWGSSDWVWDLRLDKHLLSLKERSSVTSIPCPCRF